MMFGKRRGRREDNPTEAASRRAAVDITAEVPSGPGIHGFSDIQSLAAPGAAHIPEGNEQGGAGKPIPETSRKLFMIIYLDERRETKIHSLPDESQARAFVETLLTKGVDGEAIETYQASRIEFDITFKPVVRFKGA